MSRVRAKFINPEMATDQEVAEAVLSASQGDRERANHTGTQPASTISDFFPSVRTTLLQGLNKTVRAVIESGDTVLSALGKLQAQISHFKNPIGHYDLVDVGGSTTWATASGIIFAGTNHSIPPTQVSVLIGVDSDKEFAEYRIVNGATGGVIAVSGQFTNPTFEWVSVSLPPNSLPVDLTVLEIQVRKISGGKKIMYRAYSMR